MLKILTRTTAVLGLGYLIAVGYLSLNENDILFHPADRTVRAAPAELSLRERTVTFRAADSTRLAAWIVPAATADSSAPWMLICHGNYGNIGFGGRPEFYARMRDLGINLLAFDYRGFGESDGAPSERGVYADARAAYDYLRHALRVAPERIIIFGHSLGSGVAIELASRVPAAGLVVEGAFTSVPDRGQEVYPFIPVTLIARSRFASIEKVPRLTIPKLFLHSPTDAIIPFAHGERLFAAAATPRELVRVRGGHDNAFRDDRDTYFGAVGRFVRRATTVPALAAAGIVPAAAAAARVAR